MKGELLFTNRKNSVQIQRMPSSGIMMMKLKGKLRHYDYMLGYEKLNHFSKVHNCARIVLDYQDLENISISSCIWFLLHFAPKFYSPSIQAAYIVYNNIAAQIAIQTIEEELIEMGYPLKMQQFDNLCQAISWLS